MITACLQVSSSKRPNCDQILKMPGLLNHLTGTLDDIESLKEETKCLMRTIRLPRNLGMITDRLPASQYDSAEKLGSETTDVVSSLKRVSSVPSTRADDILNELKEKTRIVSAAKPLTHEKPTSASSLKRVQSELKIKNPGSSSLLNSPSSISLQQQK
jgi:hypothetical protein